MTMNRFLAPLLLALTALPLAAAPSLPVSFQEETAQLSASELIANGRKLLAEGRALEAEPLFTQAVEAEPQNFDAQFWQIRCWIALARVNDALNAVDELTSAGQEGPTIDYLYGMAFHAKATGYLSTGVDGGSIAMSFGDAMSFLTTATNADPERFADAFHPLAEAAWHSQELEVARVAIEEATRREPENAEARFLRGRIAMSQYAVAKTDGTSEEGVAGLLKDGLDSFMETTRVLGKPTEASKISLMGQAWVQVAFCHAWRESHAELVAASSNALGWSPGDVDFGWLQSQMTDNKEFIACLAEGGAQFAQRYGDKHQGDATLRWWLGWAYFSELQYADAEREFTDSITKFPSYVNCWFYIALSRYHQRNHDGAIEAFATYWKTGPVDAVQTLASNKESNLAILDYLVGQCARAGKNIDAAMLSEMQAEVAQDVDRYWNNVGLFYRDGGEALARTKKKGAKEEAAGYYEKSWTGYQRAIQIDPENPAYLNDGAVLLHYYLSRELDRAADMYRSATKHAERLLADKNLSKEKRELFTIALRDSKNNLKLLEKGSKTR